MEAADTVVRYTTDGQDFEVPIDRLAVCRIGRGMENTIVLSDRLSSREHAMIRRNASGSCILTDLGSTNGTRHNGRPLTQAVELKSGDIILIGQQQIHFAQSSAPVETAAPAAPATQFMVEHSLVTILVSDLRGYTPLSRMLGEERVSALMSEIFRQAGEVLHTRNAWSSKFIGDAIMAVWVHSGDKIKSNDILTVFDVISEFQEIFRAVQKSFELIQPLRFGSGINTGHASIGNLGSASASDFTALGDTVNKAFRLETASKETGCDVMIAKDVFDHLVGAPPAGCLPEYQSVELKGYDTAVEAIGLRFEELGGLSTTIIESAG